MARQVGVPAGAHGRQQGAQLLFGDPGRENLRAGVDGVDPIPHFGEAFVRQAFPGVSKRRRLAHCGSILRPRRSWNAQVTRRRTAVSASLASVVTWKWSTTSLALGSSPGVRIAEA
ncbi:hypothetical protein ABLN75_12485 [Mycobacterium tuberculosis]